MRRALPLAALTISVVCAAPAGATAGGAVFPVGASAGASASGGAAAGGAQYGTVVTSPRPVARRFRLSPATVTAPRLPAVRLRVEQPGARTVRARVVFWPRGSGTPARVDLGRIAVGRDLSVRWPTGTVVAPGRYLVRLHVVGRGGAPLARGAGTSGRANLVVRPTVPAPAPAPAPATPLPVAAPAPTGPFAFPVAGPHTLGAADARFGAQRGTHRHEGQDVLAAEGVPVVAPVPGTIRHTEHQPSGAGYYVVLDGADGRAYFFAHCQKDSFAVAKGALVAPGTPLCAVGRTGRATGPHLHFEIWLGGWRASRDSRPIDPLPDLLAWGG